MKEIEESLVNYCKFNNYENILEIGPGIQPFPLAKKFVGYNEELDNYISLDIDEQKLPFNDKELDFIYSRHTLEDIQNPNFAMSEIIRCCKSGYIETPSPLVEIAKGVDGFNDSESYGGYIHHRYIVWSDIEKCEIYFLPKYSCIIDRFSSILLNQHSYDILNKYPMNWNNCFIWKDREPKIVMYKNIINYKLTPLTYMNIVNKAIETSIENNKYFITNYLDIFSSMPRP